MVDVLVIGGGPVGLFMAALLLQQGVSVRVLEQRTGAEPHSRAIGIHPPSLDALQGIGVAQDLVAEGVPIRRGLAVGGGRTLAEMSFAGVSDRYPVRPVPAAGPDGSLLEQRVRRLDPGAAPPRCPGHPAARRRRQGHRGSRRRAAAPSAIRRRWPSPPTASGPPSGRSSASRPGEGLSGQLPDGRLRRHHRIRPGRGPVPGTARDRGVLSAAGQLRRWVVRLAPRPPAGPAPTTPGWLGGHACVRERTGIDVDPGEQQHAQPLRRPHPPGPPDGDRPDRADRRRRP